MTAITLKILSHNYVIHRLNKDDELPATIFNSELYFISKTDEELSIVCQQDIKIESEKVDKNWSCLKVLGPLDFSLTGILAKIADILAKADISIFAVSTFDTDYILVKTEKLTAATVALRAADYTIL